MLPSLLRSTGPSAACGKYLRRARSDRWASSPKEMSGVPKSVGAVAPYQVVIEESAVLKSDETGPTAEPLVRGEAPEFVYTPVSLRITRLGGNSPWSFLNCASPVAMVWISPARRASLALLTAPMIT